MNDFAKCKDCGAQIGFHATNTANLSLYAKSGKIKRPVRFWLTKKLASDWGSHHARPIVLKVHFVGEPMPLNDHGLPGQAFMVANHCTKYERA